MSSFVQVVISQNELKLLSSLEKRITLTPDQSVSVEIKSLLSSKGDKRITMFPLGL